jgi:hypothetical protein
MKPTLVVVRALVVLGLLAVGWFHAGSPVDAQGGITISSPANQAVLKAGPDFASDTFSDPWDFSHRGDAALDPAQIDGFSNFTVSGGLAGGTLSARRDGGIAGSNFSILQRGYWGILNPGRTGRRFPINPAIYSKLAFKMSSTRGDQFPRIYWFHNDLGGPGGDASGWRYLDPNTPSPAGNNIFVADMTQVNHDVAWTAGLVKGFAMFPNSSTVGYPVQFDWVRLTTPDGHPASATIPVTWSGGSGTTTIQVTDGAGTTFTVASGLGGNSYNWNYGVLPPGTYTIRVVRNGVNSSTNTFTINAPPTIDLIEPDETGGEDFATAVLGNAWDMNDQGDRRFDVNIVDHLLAPSFSGGLFTATSDGQTVAFSGPTPVGDPQVYFLSNQKDFNTTDIVNTNKYHRLTFGLQVNRAGGFDLGRGSVARIFWGSASSASGGGTPYDVTTTKDIIVFPLASTYSIDLATLTTATDGGLELVNATPWTARNVRHLRIDPHEFAEQVPFTYDFVKLAADDETVNGSFTIRFAGSDGDGPAAASVALYYDTDQNTASGLTLITPNAALAAGQYVWNTSQVPAGTYYIFAVANDGLNSVGRYSSGPVRVSSSTAPSQGAIDLDTPAPNAVVTSAFEIGGWALDQGAPSGTGVDAVHFYVFPNGGAGAGVFMGAGSYGSSRTDVGNIYGSQFNNSGFHFTITGLGPGSYVLGVYAHSTVTNAFSIVKTVPFSVNSNALMSIDVPAAESTISVNSFGLSGWAIDRRAASGTGVDTIHVYAYRNPGTPQQSAAIFLGVATMGIARQDVANAYGGGASRYTNCGYVLQINRSALGLTPGIYNIVPFAHSTATNSFDNLAIVRVTLQ